MNMTENRTAHRMEKPIPGCLGRMVNLFDLTAGVQGNKLLTDKPHQGGSLVSRSQSNVARMSSPTFRDKIEDKMIVCELGRASSNKKVNGTPMKMLIDQEMTKETDGKRGPPNVVAKLMGLETLPQQQPNSAVMRSHSKGYAPYALNHSGRPAECMQQQDGFREKEIQCDIHPCPEQNFKDVYEVWQQSDKTNHVRENSPHRGGRDDNIDKTKMALIRQKFMEAKRMSMDEKLRQSKDYHDALEVLSSNKDLFLKFLQEPNSVFTQCLSELKSIPPTPEIKRITVLRPSKQVDDQKLMGSGKSNGHIDRSPQLSQTPGLERDKSTYPPNPVNQRVDEHPSHPTRIVVLKPSPIKSHDIKDPISSPCVSPRIDSTCEGPEYDETIYPREMAEEITHHMCETSMGHRRDETLLSSVFSNGYVGDESSFSKSDNEYAAGCVSDSEVMSSISRHSWDHINRFGSPYSPSSFSRASCSPESSVCREAKKRLSERWAMMTSNGNSHEKHARKSSSTLGEMLALFDSKKPVRSDDGDKEDETRGSTSSSISNRHEEGSGSAKALSRSNSAPLSTGVAGTRLNVEASDPEIHKTHIGTELTKSKSTKSSLKGKVSGIFFSRNKRSGKEKSTAVSQNDFECGTVEMAGLPSHSSGNTSDVKTESVADEVCEEGSGVCPSLGQSSPDSSGIGQSCEMVSQEPQLSVAKVASGNKSENQDQPSPISVLEPPFEEEDNPILESSDNTNQENSGGQVHTQPLKPNLIDKSPPIGTVARTLSWDDSGAEMATYTLKPSLSLIALVKKEDWLILVERLLILGGLDGAMPCDSFFTRWHSHESPLDPSLRNKYANLTDNEALHEDKPRQARSNWKLVFDCVNSTLVEITSYTLDKSLRYRRCRGAQSRLRDSGSAKLVDCVWARMKEWLSDEERCDPLEGGVINSLVVERVLSKEVNSSSWVEHLRLEVDVLGKEIERMLLEELVEEAVVDFTGYRQDCN